MIRAALREQGTIPVIPGPRNRKRRIQYDERRYKDRWRIEAMFCRLKDCRRIATRYDKLARNSCQPQASPRQWPSGSERVWTLVRLLGDLHLARDLHHPRSMSTCLDADAICSST
jgi:hypothetical protein